MRIRSTIVIVDKDSNVILNLFGMFDGDQVGQQIAEFLKGKKLMNGIMLPEEDRLNGIGDAALRLAHYLKDRTGGWYATPIDNEPDGDYAYSLIEKDDSIELRLNGELIWPTSANNDEKDYVGIIEDGYAIMTDDEWNLDLYVESEWQGIVLQCSRIHVGM